jgi:hypothetical protein
MASPASGPPNGWDEAALDEINPVGSMQPLFLEQ